MGKFSTMAKRISVPTKTVGEEEKEEEKRTKKVSEEKKTPDIGAARRKIKAKIVAARKELKEFDNK